MARNKQKQIDEVANFDNVFDSPEGLKGKWRDKYFGRDGDLILELACGWGQYTLDLAKKFPDKNIIGIDKKGDRVWQAAKYALGYDKLAVGDGGKFQANSLRNVAFCRILIEKLDDFFDEGEVDEIWITFPDPHPKPCKHGKRLTSAKFLELYKKICKPEALVHLKTDNANLFDYSLDVFEAEGCEKVELIRNIHSQEKIPDILKTLTYYERKFMSSVPINYARWRI